MSVVENICGKESNEMEVANGAGMDIELESNTEERPRTPVELIETASEACEDLLPAKSRARYQKVYNDFVKWKESKKADSNSERVVLSFFSEMAKSNKKPTTMWAHHSMLKATLKIYDKIDIENYSSLIAFLKRKAHGYEPKRAKIFCESEMQYFLDNAPDGLWLDVKVTVSRL